MRNIWIRFALLCSLPFAMPVCFAAESPASGVVAASASSAGEAAASAPLWVQVVVFVLVIGFLLISLLAVKSSLKDGDWSLAHALSEEVESTQTPDGQQPKDVGNSKNQASDGTPLVGSASRLIAFMGMLVILAFFIGVGLWLLWILLATSKVPTELDKLTSYFYGGAMLFAPYAANQLKGIVSSIVK